MSDPYLGEIQVFAFTYAPYGWAFCNGTELSIDQNSALYALLENRFGGDGRSTFRLPNLADRMVSGAGNGAGLSSRSVGQTFGVESVPLSVAQMPPHSHGLTALLGRAAPRGATPTSASGLGAYVGATAYAAEAPDVAMDARAVTSIGAGTPHANLQPILGLNPCIALGGIYPTFD